MAGMSTLPPLMMKQFNQVLKTVKDASGQEFVSGTVCTNDRSAPSDIYMVFTDKTSTPNKQYTWSANSGEIKVSQQESSEERLTPLFEYYAMPTDDQQELQWIYPSTTQAHTDRDKASNTVYLSTKNHTFQWKANECIAEGVTACVFKAEDGAGEPICIKQSRKTFTEDIEREYVVLSALSHPNIIKLVDYDKEKHIMALEWCDGSISDPGFLISIPTHKRAKLLQHAGDALTYTHNP